MTASVSARGQAAVSASGYPPVSGMVTFDHAAAVQYDGIYTSNVTYSAASGVLTATIPNDGQPANGVQLSRLYLDSGYLLNDNVRFLTWLGTQIEFVSGQGGVAFGWSNGPNAVQAGYREQLFGVKVTGTPTNWQTLTCANAGGLTYSGNLANSATATSHLDGRFRWDPARFGVPDGRGGIIHNNGGTYFGLTENGRYGLTGQPLYLVLAYWQNVAGGAVVKIRPRYRLEVEAA